jgi:hypothetical protein
MKNPTLAILLAAALVAGCGKTRVKAPGADTSTVAQTPTAVNAGDSANTKAAANECPRTGRWALCSVEKRLEQSGFVVKRVSGPTPSRAGFNVSPAVYTLGRSRLEVFIYPDEATLKRDIAAIDTLTAAPRGTKTSWETTPTFLRSGNLAAVFLTDNRERAERLTLALTAGAPQAASAVQLSPVKSR